MTHTQRTGSPQVWLVFDATSPHSARSPWTSDHGGLNLQGSFPFRGPLTLHRVTPQTSRPALAGMLHGPQSSDGSDCRLLHAGSNACAFWYTFYT